MTIEKLIEAGIVTDKTHITIMELGEKTINRVVSGYWFQDHVLSYLKNAIRVFTWEKSTGVMLTVEGLECQ